MLERTFVFFGNRKNMFDTFTAWVVQSPFHGPMYEYIGIRGARITGTCEMGDLHLMYIEFHNEEVLLNFRKFVELLDVYERNYGTAIPKTA